MSAARLREAATLLRKRADVRIAGSTGHNPGYNYGTITAPQSPSDAGRVALMAPSVALALADWFDHAASISDTPDEADSLAEDQGCDCPYCVGIPLAVAAADAILGGVA